MNNMLVVVKTCQLVENSSLLASQFFTLNDSAQMPVPSKVQPRVTPC